MTDSPYCPFCAIVHHAAPAEVVYQDDNTIGIVPLNPVTDGHVLIIPTKHVADALEKPMVTALAMRSAAWYARTIRNVNIITSVGMLATQTVRHLHIDVVPRRPHDGLLLPWGGNEAASREYLENAELFYGGSDGQPSGQPAKPRPVHVEFWRCGRAQKGGRGWTRCLTWELCKNHGCQTLEAERQRGTRVSIDTRTTTDTVGAVDSVARVVTDTSVGAGDGERDLR